MSPSRAFPLLAVVAAVVVVSTMPTASAAAAGPSVLYVDGKLGDDANSGTSLAEAFRTIDRAVRTIPKGSAPGWRVIVRGYADHIYRERPTHQGFKSWGSASEPIVFEAFGYAAKSSSYQKPIISGSDLAPLPGKSWEPTSANGVWRTAWPSPPAMFGAAGATGESQSVIFQDGTTWLWGVPSLDDLRDRAKAGTGGFWYDGGAKKLYVSAIGPRDPDEHTIDVVMRNAFYFKGQYGVRNIVVRGFQVQHADSGIAFVNGADHGTIVDNVLIANLHMGIHVSGSIGDGDDDPATDFVIARNVGKFNSVQAIKISKHAQDVEIHHNRVKLNALQGIKVQGSPPGSDAALGATRDILIRDNEISDQVFRTPHRRNDNATGITIANGATRVTVEDNRIWNNGIGIHVVQEGGAARPIDGVVIRDNLIFENRRFGLNLFDGKFGTGGGALVAHHNLYWDNRIGVVVDYGSRNKTLHHETIYASRDRGVVVNGRGTSARLTLSKSLVSHTVGAGIYVARGGILELRYVGHDRNGEDGIVRYGSVKVSSVGLNRQPPGYLSRSASHQDFLRIAPTSFQYTAGPDNTPIGARY